MGSKDKKYQAMKHDGETGKTTSVSKFTTAENARSIMRRERERARGTDAWFTVDRTRRKGRGQ